MGDGRSGLPLHSVEMGLDPGDAGASPPPIVLLHGLLGAGNNFRGWAKRITAALEATHAPARRIVAVDLRNHGESPHAADMSYATMAADVSLLLERLHLERCVLVGHSMGGKTAMLFSLKFPELISKVFIMDISPKYYPNHNQHIIDTLKKIDLNKFITRKEIEKELSNSIIMPDLRKSIMKSML